MQVMATINGDVDRILQNSVFVSSSNHNDIAKGGFESFEDIM